MMLAVQVCNYVIDRLEMRGRIHDRREVGNGEQQIWRIARGDGCRHFGVGVIPALRLLAYLDIWMSGVNSSISS